MRIETAEPLELVKARLTELSERLTEAGGANCLKASCQVALSISLSKCQPHREWVKHTKPK